MHLLWSGLFSSPREPVLCVSCLHVFLPVILWIISTYSEHVCIIYAWIAHRWIANSWIVYRELEQPPWWFLYFWHCAVNTWNRLDVDKKFIWGLRRKMLKWMACMHLTYLLYHIKSVSLHSQRTQKKLADFKPCFFAVIQINWRK